MSASIDERIVSMKFDNKQFQSGVADSLTSINNLKKGLNFEGATKGLDGLSDSARRVSFDGISNGLESIKLKFSALQVIAVTALANITNSAINTGKQMIASLTTDPIKDGFREYETQMNAIQTIMANTSAKGTTLDEVKKALAELNTYSDKTIYNFTEMAKNIGTFTAAGVDLKTSTAAIKGIANLAAVSGSSSEQASTAMYQLSQALASGTVKLQDWNSVVNAGMGGEVFQNALKETAKVHGVNIDAMIKKEGSFRETLKKEWLTSSILTETLNKFTGDLSETQLKSMGYTDEQIKGIIKMGVTANDAATKVKTATQLMDTLKEAVGSGWAQTWQTIFGDFEEAKTLFTNVSNVLGGMIGKSSEARNSMLTGWKDLGGRTALIDAVSNAFTGLMGVVKSIGGAFRDIFPATTSAQLYNITNALKNFTENLKFSDSTLSNIRSTFKGVFAIFDIGKTILLAVANAISIVLGGTGDLASSVLGVTGSFGEWLTALDKTIKQSDIFNKVLTTLAYGIKNGLGAVTYVFDLIVEGVGMIATKISDKLNFPGFEAFHSLLALMGKRMTSIGNEADNMSIMVGGAFVSMGKAIANSKFGSIMTSIWDTVKTICGAIGTLIERMVKSVSTTIQNADFSSLLDGVAAMSIGGMLLAFRKFMKSLSESFGESKGLFGNIKGVLDDVRGSFEAYQQNLKAGVLIKLGVAIALLAGSIVAISLIDSGKLVSSLAAIGTLFTQLLVAMKIYSMIGEFKGKVIASSIVMLAMSTSILILSGAMKNLASLDWNGLVKGVVGIAALAGTLVGAAKILSSGSGAMIKGSAGMVVFALAIKVLASACVTLSSLNWNGLVKGLVGVGVLIAEISLFLNAAKFSSKSILTATGIVILASAIKILASACSDFGSMDWTNIGKGLVSIGALLTELTLFTNLNGNASNMISTGIGLIAISAAMKIFASAMLSFGGMSWESIAKGLVTMGGALTEIGIAVNLMPSNLPVTATGLILVGAALNIIAAALQNMGGMSWDAIAKGMVTLGGSLAILSVGLNAMNGTLMGSAALLIAAGALAVLTPTLTILGAMTWTSIVKGLVDLAATIAIFGISAAVLTPVIPSMIGLSGALVLLGVSMLGIGAGLALVGVGLAGVATGFTLLAGVTTTGATAIVAALGVIIVGIAALIPAIMKKIAEGIVAFCKVFTDGIPAILQSVTTIIKAIVGCIVTNIPVIINGILQTLSAIISTVVKWLPTILNSVTTIIKTILKCIIDNVSIITNGVLQILSSVLSAVAKWTPKIAQQVADILLALLKVISNNVVKFANAGVEIILALLKVMASNAGKFASAAVDIILVLLKVMADNVGKFVKAGIDIVVGFLNGISNSLPEVINAAFNLVVSFVNGLADSIRKNSGPIADASYNLITAIVDSLGTLSGKMMDAGIYAAEGFVKGLISIPGKIWAAGESIGQSALNAAKNILDIHSPSRAFQNEVGAMIGAGMAKGIYDSTHKAVKASSDLSKSVYDAAKEWVDNKKYYNQLSLEEELYVWQTIQSKYRNGTEARKEADKEVYRLRREIDQKDLNDTIKAIDDKKYYNQMSLQEELAIWQHKQKVYRQGTEERKQADKEVYRLNKEITKSGLDDTIQLIEDRKYYNNISLQEELSIWQRKQKIYKQGTEERKQADKEVYRISKEITKSGLDDTIKLIDDKKYYNQMSLQEELAIWQHKQKVYRQGTEERKQADKEVYRISKEITKAGLDDTIQLIQDRKYYNNISLQEELAIWKRKQTIYKQGTEERKQADKEVYRISNEIYKKDFDDAVKAMDQKKYYNKLSLVEELATWQGMQKKYKEGTEERIQADKEVYRVKNEIMAKQTQIDNDYYTNSKSVNDKLKEDIKSVTDEYNKAVESRTSTLYSTYGLFDQVAAKESITGQQLVSNLEGQVKAFEDWQKNINTLTGKGVSEELMTELKNMGPKSAAQIEALNSLSKPELDKYVSLWSTKHTEAKTEAISELQSMQKDTTTKITELTTAANIELEKYKQTWITQTKELNQGVKIEITDVKTNTLATVAELRTGTETEITNLTDNIQTIFSTPDWVSIGANIINGIKQGVNSKAIELANQVASIALMALNAAKAVLGIHSPSREFAKLGEFSGQGFINGLASYTKKVGDTASNVGSAAIDSMSNAISAITDVINGNIDSNPVIRPVLDLTDIQNGSNQLYGMMSDLGNQSINGSIVNNSRKASSISSAQLSANTLNDIAKTSNNVMNSSTPKQPITLQLLLSNGRAIAEYIVDDLDTLTGNKNILNGRMVGL